MEVDLEKYASTFSKTSYDGMKKESLVKEDYRVVYNFDDIAKDICQEYRAGEYLSSADALSFSNGLIYLIEFKNQPTRNIDRRVIQKKAFDSIYLLQQAVFNNISIEDMKKRTLFYVIHAGSSSPSFDSFKKKASTLAKQNAEIVDFGLSKYSCFYKEIHTLSSKEFVKEHLYKIT